ncbi:hypothetical protein evm_004923 [Chilo suppressalis]|nr:hypothetical protein evm_004923 [Chilo suppressalis]
MQPNREQPPPYSAQSDPAMVHHPTIVQPTIVQPMPVVYSVQTVTVQPGLVGSSPTLMTCPSCLNQIVTRVDRSPSCRTHLMALLCLLLFWPCMCVPYCVDSCNDADHYCPHCNAYIGSYKF